MNSMNELLLYDSAILRTAIHYLTTLTIYPDIKINVISNLGGTVTFRAILSLPNDEILKEETTVIVELLEDEEFIEVLKKNLLSKIGIKYINRAYEFRMNNENVAESCQVNNLSKMLKKWLKECEE